MAAVTITRTKYNVAGSMRDQLYTITGNSGDTLTVGLTTVRLVNDSPNANMTSYAVAAGTVPGTSVITFTASAPYTAADIEVIGN